MATAISDVLELIGGELKDGADATERFRNYISKEKWDIYQYKEWLDECIREGKGSHDPYNRAFQDLVICLGKKLGFKINFGKYQVKHGEEGYDGLWEKDAGEIIVLEAKTTTWPLSDIEQLGKYIKEVTKSKGHENVYGLYIIGSGDVKPLIQQIHGSKYKDVMRIIHYEDLIQLLKLKEELEPVIGEKEATLKIQNLLFPVESIDIGNVLKLIIEIAEARSTAKEGVEEEEGEKGELKEEKELPWTKTELLQYLGECTSYQRVLLAALIQAEEEPVPKKKVLYLMTQIAQKRPSEGIDKKITGLSIAGARAGLKMRRKNINKEDIIDSEWDESVGDYIYKIKPQYRSIIEEWVKNEGLLI